MIIRIWNTEHLTWEENQLNLILRFYVEREEISKFSALESLFVVIV